VIVDAHHDPQVAELMNGWHSANLIAWVILGKLLLRARRRCA